MSVILYHLLLFTILSFTDCTLVLLTASDTNIKNKQSWKYYRNKGDPVGRRPWAKGVKALGWKNTYFRSSIYNSFSLHFQRGVVACVWAVGHNHDCLLPLVVCLVCLPPDLRMTHYADAGAAATPCVPAMIKWQHLEPWNCKPSLPPLATFLGHCVSPTDLQLQVLDDATVSM